MSTSVIADASQTKQAVWPILATCGQQSSTGQGASALLAEPADAAALPSTLPRALFLEVQLPRRTSLCVDSFEPSLPPAAA